MEHWKSPKVHEVFCCQQAVVVGVQFRSLTGHQVSGLKKMQVIIESLYIGRCCRGCDGVIPVQWVMEGS